MRMPDLEDPQLMARAAAAWYRRAPFDCPSDAWSIDVDGREYVVLENGLRRLAVYRLRDGRLRWVPPAAWPGELSA
jgi:hypothetical protein